MQIAARVLGLLGQYIRSLGGAFKLWLALKVEQDGSFLDLAVFEDSFDYLITVQWLACFLEDLGDNICNGATAVAP